MGKRGGQKRKKSDLPSSSSLTSLSIREQASGKKQTHNSKSILKLNHLQNLAQWSSSTIVNVKNNPTFASLGAFYGRRFAEFGESLGISPHPSSFPCQRCEMILQPGTNCTVRIETNRVKHKRHKKTKTDMQNNIAYTCHFCSYRNLKRGTPKGYMRDLVPPKARSLNPECLNTTVEKSNLSNPKTEKTLSVPPLTVNKACSPTDSSPPSSSVKSDVKLLDSKRSNRIKPQQKGLSEDKLVGSAPAEKEQTSGTSKRRRKSWTSLKDIAESEERDRNQRFKNFTIPFVL